MDETVGHCSHRAAMVSTGLSHPDNRGTLECFRCQKKSKARITRAVRILASEGRWEHLRDNVRHQYYLLLLADWLQQFVSSNCLDGQGAEFSEAPRLELFLNKNIARWWDLAACSGALPAVDVPLNAL